LARTVALVGADSLIGREVRDLLSTSALDLRLIGSADQEAGMLTEVGGEPVVVGRFDADLAASAAAVILAGGEDSSRAALQSTQARFIDLTYAGEGDPRACLRAPGLEPETMPFPSSSVHVIAHPAAMALALILGRLHRLSPLARSVANVFEPASERGSAGLRELEQQSLKLLSFQKLPKAVFDAQAGFNLLSRYGAEAPVALERIESRMERHLAALLALSGGAPMPSLRLIQAPVFHGYSCSLWVEFGSNPGAEAIEQALSAEPVEVRSGDEEPPSIAGIAGQALISVGAISSDRHVASACWLWLVADNLRLSAEAALAVAGQLAGSAG